MTSSQIAPPVFKGAIATLDPLRPSGNVIVFQYNPDSLSRTLTAKTAGGEEGGGMQRLSAPPDETIKLSVEIDATDQLERSDPLAKELGILPELAALESLLYPKSAVAVANEVLARAGIIEILPMEAPLTILVWSARRVLPVRITEFTVTEEAFDTALQPIRAKVDLGLKVLTYQELGMLSAGGALSLAHHVSIEVLAAAGSGVASPAVARAIG